VKGTDLPQRADPVQADDAAQAQRDVTGAARPPSGSRDPRAAPPALRSEQQLAEDQWLRRLPDDPGGLLRRKFLIQHLIRQGTPP
jgi:Ca-activated chloride channel family protein